MKRIWPILEVLENWEGVVPDEEGVDFVEVAEAGVVALWIPQDLEAQGGQFQLLEFNWPILLSLLLLFIVKTE